MVAVPQQRAIDLGRFPKQKHFVFDPSKYVVWCGGLGSAKTVSGTIKLMLYVQNNPGARILVIAPKYGQLKAGTMTTFFEWFPQDWVANYNRSQDEMFVDTTNGCRIYFRNAQNPDSFRSMELAASWLDEPSYMPPNVLPIVQGRLRQQRGNKPYPYQIWATGTPAGQNWVWQKFINASSRIAGVSTYYSDSRENPWTPKEYKDELVAQYEGPWFQQEIEGKFVTYAGLVYPMFQYGTHVRPAPASFKKVFAGADFGLTVPTSVHLYGVDEAGRYWAFREFYERRARLHEVLALLSSWAKEFPGLQVFCDPHAASEIDTLKANAVRAVGASANVADGIRLVSSRLEKGVSGEPGLYVTEACPRLIAEFQSYSWDEKVGGAEGTDKKLFDKIKQGQNDHAVDDLRYAMLGESTRPAPHNILGFRFG